MCSRHELFVAFKERNPDVKIAVSKFCTHHPKWCAIAGLSGAHLVCVSTAHQNTILLVDTLNLEVINKDLVNTVVYDPSYRECMMHVVLTVQEQMHYINFWRGAQWHWSWFSISENYQFFVQDELGDFAENYQFFVQDEIVSYHCNKEYCTLHSLVYFIDDDRNIQHNSLCFISDDYNHNTNFVYKIQITLVDYLLENLPVVVKR